MRAWHAVLLAVGVAVGGAALWSTSADHGEPVRPSTALFDTPAPILPRAALAEPTRDPVEPAGRAARVTLAGRVVEADRGTPIGGALVEARALDERTFGAARSGADGRFRIDGELRGATRLDVRATADGYLPCEAAVFGMPRTDVSFALHPGARGATLTGRIVGPSGVAVADARVVFVAREREVALDLVRPTVVDSPVGVDGTFRLTQLAPGHGTLRVVAAEHDDHVRFLDLPAASVTDLGAIQLERFAWSALSGVVRDLAGVPIAGAELRIPGAPEGCDARATSDLGGRFRLGRVRPGRLMLPCDARGVSRLFELQVPPGREHRVDLRMPLGARFLGGVVRSGGAPVAFARVVCGDPAAPLVRHWTTTDREGRFRLDGLSDVAQVVSVMRWEPYQSRDYADLALDRDDHVLEFPARPPILTLRGRVCDAGGAGLGGAVVFAGEPGSVDARTVADPTGAYALELCLPEDDSSLVHARYPGLRESHAAVRAADFEAGDLVLDLVLEPRAEVAPVAGTVRTENGRPLAGASCSLGSGGSPEAPGLGSATTDSLGAFRIDDVPVGTLRLRVRAEGFAVFEEEVTVAPGAGATVDARVPEPPRATLAVVVRDRDGGPVADAWVWVGVLDGWATFASGWTDAAGRAGLERVPAGPAMVFVEPREGLSCALDVEVSAPGTAEVAVVVPGGAERLVGRILRADGSVAAGAVVELRGLDHPGARLRATVCSDDLGRFVIEELPVGRFEVRARSSEQQGAAEVTVPGPPVELRLGAR